MARNKKKKKPAPTKRTAPAAHTSRPEGRQTIPEFKERRNQPKAGTSRNSQVSPSECKTDEKPASPDRKPGGPSSKSDETGQARTRNSQAGIGPKSDETRQAHDQQAASPVSSKSDETRQAPSKYRHGMLQLVEPRNAAATRRERNGKVTRLLRPRIQSNKKFKAQRFNLATNTRPTKVASVNFQQGRRIQGSQNWQGGNYWAFRNYRSAWHDRGWWHNHYNRVVFVYGGWYAWNAGYWYPAWGYAPNSYYA